MDRWMDKEVVVHKHNVILLSHKMERIWVSSDEVDEPRTYYTERSESERERQIYSNAHIQNLEKWYWRIYIQGSDGASLVAQRLKRLPAMWETRVQFLGWEDPLEKEMATHSRTLAWKIPWIEKPGRLQSMGSQRVGHDWATSLSFFMVWGEACLVAQW